MQTIELKVQGMSCGSCVKHVRAALSAVPGVRGVEVDLASASARVQADDGVSVDLLRGAMTDAGYEPEELTR